MFETEISALINKHSKFIEIVKVFYQKSITLLPVKLHCQFYLTDQIAMHEFFNKICQLSIYYSK